MVGKLKTNANAITDDKLYSVTWVTGRRVNLTKKEAVEYASRIEQDWVRYACRGRPDVKIWYRDGNEVGRE